MPRPITRAYVADLFRRWMSGGALSPVERQSIEFLARENTNRQIARLMEV